MKFIKLLASKPEFINSMMALYLTEEERSEVAYHFIDPLVKHTVDAYDSVGDANFVNAFERLEKLGVHLLPIDD